MTERIQVGGQVPPSLKWWRLLPLVFFAWGGAVCYFDDWFFHGIPLIVLGLLIALPLESYAAIRGWQRRWVEDIGTGLVLTDRTSSTKFSDDQVLSIAKDSSQVISYRNGAVTALRRTIRLWTNLTGNQSPVATRLIYFVPTGSPDPLAPLFNRLLEALLIKSQRTLDQGQTVNGDGWELTSNQLTVGKGKQPALIPIRDISFAAILDEQVCIWRLDEEFPAVKLPLSGRNAHLLASLGSPYFHGFHDSRIEGAANTGLGFGRVLLERRVSWMHQFQILGSAVLFMLALVPLVCSSEHFSLSEIAFFSGMLVLAAALASWFVVRRFELLRFYERGVVSQSLFHRKELAYEKVDKFVFAVARLTVNGSYGGTFLELILQGCPERELVTITYKTKVTGNDDQLDFIRDRLANQFSKRLLTSISAGAEAAWTDSLAFVPQGIRYTPAGVFGRSAQIPQIVPLSDYGGHTIEAGVFSLYRTSIDGRYCVHVEQTSAPNFYPGYFALLQLMHSNPSFTAITPVLQW